MRTVAEKLDHFANDIMADVAEKRQEILKDVDKAISDEYNKYETQYYTKAYEMIQEGLKKIDKEKNEIMSKAVMDNKVNQLSKRNEIIQKIFNDVRKELRNYTKSEDYYPYLLQLLRKNLEEIGEGDICITLNVSDEVYLEKIKKEFNVEVKLENKHIDFIGGCKLLNTTTRMFIDDTFEKRLQNQRDSFLQMCKLEIE